MSFTPPQYLKVSEWTPTHFSSHHTYMSAPSRTQLQAYCHYTPTK